MLKHQEEMKCAICNDKAPVHIVSVRIYPWMGQNTELLMNGDGFFVNHKPYMENKIGRRRGTTVEICFYCEFCRHTYTESYTFHKGYTYLDTTDIGEDALSEIKEMWRD